MENINDKVLNNLIVVKRSGQRVNFNSLKIAVAIKQAFDNTSDNYSDKEINKIYVTTLDFISKSYNDRKTINVEDIQDIIESILKQNKCLDVYNNFSEYRTNRALSRKAFSTKRQHKFVKAMEKIGSMNSIDEKPNQILYKFGKTISSEYTKSYIIDSKYIRSYEEGQIFIHNFSYFNLGYISDTHLKINNILEDDNCFYEVLNLLLSAKQEIQGEICINNFDILLSKYIVLKFKHIFKNYLYKYLKLIGYISFIDFNKISNKINNITTIDFDLNEFKDIFQNEQSLLILNNAYQDAILNINEMIETNINKLLKSLNNCQLYNKKYSISIGIGNTPEENLVQNCIFNQLITSSILDNVCIIYKITKNTDFKKIIKLIYDNKNIRFIFEKDSLKQNDIEYFSTGLRIFENINNISQAYGRMNIANTSLNMARLGLEYKTINTEFYNELDNLLELIKNQLLFVFETIGDKNKNNYQILFNNNIIDDEKLEKNQKIRKIIKNGTLNINLIGLYECAIMIDKESPSKIIIKLLKYIRQQVDLMSQELKLNFTVSAINYIDVSQELIDLDKTVFGLIPNVTNKTYYTNINYLLYTNKIDNFDINSQYQKLLSGGNVLEILIPKNISLKNLNNLLFELAKSDINFVNIKRSSA